MPRDRSVLPGELERLAVEMVRAAGAVPAIRISQARLGSCEWGPYYGHVRCRIQPSARGDRLIVFALHHARKQYRSLEKAERELREYYPHRFWLKSTAPLDREGHRDVIGWLLQHRREKLPEDAVERLRAVETLDELAEVGV